MIRTTVKLDDETIAAIDEFAAGLNTVAKDMVQDLLRGFVFLQAYHHPLRKSWSVQVRQEYIKAVIHETMHKYHDPYPEPVE